MDGDGNVMEFDDYLSLEKKCAAERLPPARVKDLLMNEKKFTNKGDVQVVANLYNAFFEAVSSSTETLR